MRAWIGILAVAFLVACGSDNSGGGAAGSGGASGSGGSAGSGGAAGQAGSGGDAGQAGSGGSTNCTADLQTDPDNCGACGHSCQGGECQAGQCQPVTLASGLAYPYRLAPDATNVYVTVAGTFSGGSPNFDGMVGSIPLGGGAMTDLSQGQLAAYGLALDASNVYFSYWADSVTSVWGGSKTGSHSVNFGAHMSMFIVTDAPSVSATASNIYFLDGYSVFTAGVGGGDATELLSTNAPLSGLALAGSDLVFGEYGNDDPSGAPLGNGRLLKAPTSGGTPVVLDANGGAPYAVTVDQTQAFYSDMAGGRVVAAALDGSGATVVATGQSNPYAVVVDAGYVYWTTRGGPYWEHDTSCGGAGTLMRAPKTGGAAVTLASGLDCAGWLAQDQTSLYWVEMGSLPYHSSADGSIRKLAK